MAYIINYNSCHINLPIKTTSHAKVYTGDNWHEAANAIIRNVKTFGFTQPVVGLSAIRREAEWNLTGSHGLRFGEGSMKKNWRFSFDFKPTKTAATWDTMLSITDNGDAYKGNPRNVLRLYFIPNSLKISMHFVFDTTDFTKSPHFDTPDLTVNEWHTIEVSQMVKEGNTIFVFQVNGVTHHNVVNKNPHMFPALDFYNGFDGNAWGTTSGQMKDFQFFSSDLASDIPPYFGTYE